MASWSASMHAPENGQTVEIAATKEGQTSRDWLNPQQGYCGHAAARQKIKQYFSALEEEELLVRGRGVLTKEIQREGHGHAAEHRRPGHGRLGFQERRGAVHRHRARRGRAAGDPGRPAGAAPRPFEPEGAEAEVAIGHSHAGDAGDMILRCVGVGKLMTPRPLRASQRRRMRSRATSPAGAACRSTGSNAGGRLACPQETRSACQCPVGGLWRISPQAMAVFRWISVVQAMDRQPLRLTSPEVLSREKLNVIAVTSTLPEPQAWRAAHALHP